MLASKKVNDFLAELSSDSPAPGGGSAAALSGALAASLVSMVCQLTLGREKFAAAEGKVRPAAAEAVRIRDRLAALMDEDARAFTAVLAAYRLPKGTEEEKAARTAAIQSALHLASSVPLECAELSFSVLELAEAVAPVGNQNAISDAGVAALLAEAAVWGALLNVDINAKSITDSTRAEELRKRAVSLRERSSARRKLILGTVHERM
ncbi:cyclodeaminase/cyclohydrolase family protein [Candidatus Woesearchaeota archaeon]|nr:cyclodeaminase/cyclohydrolase family protein [Candidatus Woesearchaeota archaeon]